MYLKAVPASESAELHGEAERLDWLRGKVPAPQLVAFATDEDGAYLLMTAVPGVPLISFNASGDDVKRSMAALLGESVAMLHSVDATGCPFLAKRGAEPAAETSSPVLPNDVRKAAILHEL